MSDQRDMAKDLRQVEGLKQRLFAATKTERSILEIVQVYGKQKAIRKAVEKVENAMLREWRKWKATQ